jgi:hypothetical protein
MLLFGLSPVALVWGDSMRAYGIGCLFSILAIGFLGNSCVSDHEQSMRCWRQQLLF